MAFTNSLTNFYRRFTGSQPKETTPSSLFSVSRPENINTAGFQINSPGANQSGVALNKVSGPIQGPQPVYGPFQTNVPQSSTQSIRAPQIQSGFGTSTVPGTSSLIQKPEQLQALNTAVQKYQAPPTTGFNANDFVSTDPITQARIKAMQEQVIGSSSMAGTGATDQPAYVEPYGLAAGQADPYQLSALEKAYLATLSPTEQELAYNAKINDIAAQQANLAASEQLGLNKIKDQTIAMPFVTGQSASLQRSVAGQMGALGAQATPLVNQLAAAQATRGSQAERAKAELEMKPSVQEVGGALVQYDPATGQYKEVYRAPEETKSELLSPNEAATLGVPYGTTKAQAAMKGVIPKEQLTGTDKIRVEMDLAKNYDTYTKDIRQAQRGLDIVNVAWNEARQAGLNGKSLNAASQAMITAFLKVLDPTSVVRESEYGRIGAGQNVWDRMAGTYEKLTQGGAGVTQKELASFADLAKQLMQGYQQEQADAAQRIKTQATNYGLNIENILTPGGLNLLNNAESSDGGTQVDTTQQTINQYKQQYPALANYSDDEIRQALGFTNASGQALNSPVESLKVPATNKTVSTSMGNAIITGYGSKYWTPGLDIVFPGGKSAPVAPPSNFTVLAVNTGYNKGFGNQVKIKDASGQEIWLSHLSSINNLKPGQTYKAGTPVGLQGNTGKTYGATGIHVDITMPKPGGGYYDAKQVAAYFNATA